MGIFSPQWGGNPDYDFERPQTLFEISSNKLTAEAYAQLVIRTHLSVLQDRHAHAVKQWQGSPVLLGQRYFGTIKEVNSELANMPKFSWSENLEKDHKLLGLKFVLNYGRPVATDDPMFRYVAETISRLKAANIPTILYITPLNVEDIRRFGGDALARQVEHNLSKVRQVANRQGWPLIDLSHALPSARFVDRECACEHVDASGRLFIANRIAVALRADRRMAALQAAYLSVQPLEDTGFS